MAHKPGNQSITLTYDLTCKMKWNPLFSSSKVM